MSRPSDRHLDLVDEDAYHRAARAISALEEADLDYVLGGGWAVFAHEPRVPSVDVDVYLPPDASEIANETLTALGLTVERGGEVELLGRQSEVEMWGIGDPDLGIPEPSYVPDHVFEGRLERQLLALQGDKVEAVVPTRPPLLVTKVVALANRDLAYQAFSKGTAAMRLGPVLMGHVRSKARGYWERKAGKDLFDISLLLLHDEAGPIARDLFEACELLEDVRARTEDLAEAVVSLARDLADRRSTSDPVQAMTSWLHL